ncbi:MAG: ROK family protein [Ferruginibacter sp.]
MKLAIGIDLGGTNVKGILLNEQGCIVKQHSMPTNDDANGEWRENVFAMVEYLKAAAQAPVDVIGLSCPGLADEQNKCIVHLPVRLEGLIDFIWEDHFCIETYIMNDAHAALIAEAKFGALKGYKNAVLLTLGTGVGGGILINGELYQGQNQMAGHFGHISINPNDDELSIIGMPGSLEYAVGNYSIRRRSLGRFVSTHELVKAYRENDVFATWLWLDLTRKLALSIASIGNSLSPEVVVLTGGISQAGETLLNPLRDFLAVYCQWPKNKHTPVILSEFSDMSGAIGAAAFALGKHLDKKENHLKQDK